MVEKEIYIDNNATTKPYPEVVEIMAKVMGSGFGNPSSSHSAGQRAKGFIDESRIKLSNLLGCNPSNLVFTSSGTESNNMAFYSCYRDAKEKCRIITSTVEHSSIKKMCSHLEINGVEVLYLDADTRGYIDLEKLEKLLNDKCVSLVSVQWVNNETGIIQPVREIGNICRSKKVLFHTDAAQAVGKLEIQLADMPVDFLSLTGHKFNSPQGIGAIYSYNKLDLNPVMFGGFQEDHFRPGTENVPGIAGMGKASEIRKKNLEKFVRNMTEMRDAFDSQILEQVSCAKINGDITNRVCNTTNIQFKGVDGRKLLSRLDSVGVRCSQSSACTNSSPDPSYVLLAMGLTPEQAYSSIRFSFSHDNTMEEIVRVVEYIKKFCKELRH
jgi:cysteine desulfurase